MGSALPERCDSMEGRRREKREKPIEGLKGMWKERDEERERETDREEDEGAKHQATCCLMQHVFSLHSPADWLQVSVWATLFMPVQYHEHALIFLSQRRPGTILFYSGWYANLWTLYWKKEGPGFTCEQQRRPMWGSGKRPSQTTQQRSTTHNPEHSCFDHLEMNWAPDKLGSPHYHNIQSRNKGPVSHEALMVLPLWWKWTDLDLVWPLTFRIHYGYKPAEQSQRKRRKKEKEDSLFTTKLLPP